MNKIDLEAKERRQSNRGRLRLRALIKIGDNIVLTCETRNISERGALLAVDDTSHIPNQFELSIPEVSIKKVVRVAWRRTRSVGVEFD